MEPLLGCGASYMTRLRHLVYCHSPEACTPTLRLRGTVSHHTFTVPTRNVHGYLPQAHYCRAVHVPTGPCSVRGRLGTETQWLTEPDDCVSCSSLRVSPSPVHHPQPIGFAYLFLRIFGPHFGPAQMAPIRGGLFQKAFILHGPARPVSSTNSVRGFSQ